MSPAPYSLLSLLKGTQIQDMKTHGVSRGCHESCRFQLLASYSIKSRFQTDEAHLLCGRSPGRASKS